MQTIFPILLEIALVAVTVSIIQLLVLVFRNPRRPQWLRHGFAESVAVIGIVMGITLSVATLVAGLVGAGVNVFVTLVVAAIVPLAIAFVNDRLLRVRDRLRRAETGESPFAPLSGARPLADHSHRVKA